MPKSFKQLPHGQNIVHIAKRQSKGHGYIGTRVNQMNSCGPAATVFADRLNAVF